MFEPRPMQQEVLRYRGGRMGVSAVPGSGKTQTLSYLAAELVAGGLLAADQEVLVVTLVNSAVDNFSARVASFTRQRGLLPRMMYRVRTLHGLAHDIVRERPGLAGLSENFQIVDERVADAILSEAALAWLRTHEEQFEDFLDPNLDLNARGRVIRQHGAELVKSVAGGIIRQAKDLEWSPARLRAALDARRESSALLEMGWAVFDDYQRALAYRGAVDFDDLIMHAIQTLRADPDYLARLRYRWPFVLEDEAQDSSRLQEQILRLLVGPDGNWVRVGDPNQAIFETFTTASPEYLRDFLEEKAVLDRTLPNSGRSMSSIIRLANYMIDWTQFEHPVVALRSALTPPHIETTPPGDPQPNPPDHPESVSLIGLPYTPAEEVAEVAKLVQHWLVKHPDQTLAVLTPTNKRGFSIVSELKRRNVPYVEMLRSSRSTRETAGALTHILRWLAEPTSPRRLAQAYRVWRRDAREQEAWAAIVSHSAGLLQGCRHVEAYLWPRAGQDWLAGLDFSQEPEQIKYELHAFRDLAQRWSQAAVLPVDQLLLTLAQDVFKEPADLALTHKLALVLDRAADANPDWRLPELAYELEVVARNERRFLGLSNDDTAFDPDQHPGVAVVATMHKAKGLEWDHVFLVSLNNFDFPSALPHDSYVSERWFIRPGLDLQAEALGQLQVIENPERDDESGRASQAARLEFSAERLRLLYVGMTRARKALTMTWNTGYRGDQQQATAFIALQTFWEGMTDAASE